MCPYTTKCVLILAASWFSLMSVPSTISWFPLIFFISALSAPVPPPLLFRSAHGLQFGRMLPSHFLQVHLRQSGVRVNVLVLFIKLLCTCAVQCAISQDIKYFSASRVRSWSLARTWSLADGAGFNKGDIKWQCCNCARDHPAGTVCVKSERWSEWKERILIKFLFQATMMTDEEYNKTACHQCKWVKGE